MDPRTPGALAFDALTDIGGRALAPTCARCLRDLLPSEPRALTPELAAAVDLPADAVACPPCLRALYRERDLRDSTRLDREVTP